MKVYHESYMEIKNIDFAFCKKRRDFGRNSYVTKLLSQAKYRATGKGELKFRKLSHQICFCTLQSLQAIRKVENFNFTYSLKNISKQIIEKLITEQNLDKIIATDKFYDSDTFTQLSNESTKLYLKDWTEIYEFCEN
jgi:hypothetical protein